jgi:hypothetical protein
MRCIIYNGVTTATLFLAVGCAASTLFKGPTSCSALPKKAPRSRCILTLIREPRCVPLRTSCTAPSHSLVLCSVPFPSTGTLKVNVQLFIDWSILSENDNVARNTGTCLYMFWTGLGCLSQCINSIVWNKNMINRAPVYCDICKSKSVTPFLGCLLSISSLRLPQQPVFKSRSISQYRLLYFASIAYSIGLLG